MFWSNTLVGVFTLLFCQGAPVAGFAEGRTTGHRLDLGGTLRSIPREFCPGLVVGGGMGRFLPFFFIFLFFSFFVPFAETKKDLIDTLILPLHPRASLPCRPRVPRRLASATTSRTPSAGGAGSAASTFSVRRFFILRALVWCLAPCDGSWFALRPTAQAIILMCCLLCVCVAGRSCRWLHCRRTVASFCIIGPEGDRRLLTSPSVHRYR